MPGQPLFIFADTNIFLEFQRIDDPRWRAAFDNRPLVFVLAAAVLRELDRAKGAQRLRTRKRARALLPWLGDQISADSTLGNGARLEFFRPTPVSVLDRGELDRATPDDLILASAIAYAEQHQDRELVFLSEDVGAAIRAKAFSLRSVSPPAELRLPAELSAEERELRDLRQKIETLQMGAPQITLSAGDEPVKVSVNPFPLSEQDWVAQEMEAERAALPDTSAYGDRYATEVAEHLRRFEDYARQAYLPMRLLRRSFRLALTISNTGGAPATDIDLFVEAPEDLVLSDKLPQLPERPKRPTQPNRFGVVDLRDLSGRFDLPRFAYPTPHVSSPFQNVDDWIFTRPNHAQIHINNAKHNLEIALPGLVAWFPGDVCNFSIAWNAHLGNTREPFGGRLNFTVAEDRDEDGFQRHILAPHLPPDES